MFKTNSSHTLQNERADNTLLQTFLISFLYGNVMKVIPLNFYKTHLKHCINACSRLILELV